MSRWYPYLYRFFKILFLTVFFLSLIQLFFPFSNGEAAGFCLYSGGIILAGELFRMTKRKKELGVIAALLFLCLLLTAYLHREWVGKMIQSFRLEVILLFLLPAFISVLFLFERRLIWLSGLLLPFLIFAAVSELPLFKAGAVSALCFLLVSLMEGAVCHRYGTAYREKLCGFILLPLLLFFCLAALPVHDEPYPFTMLKQAWNQLRESGYVLYTELSLLIQRQSSDFFVQFTGYSEKGMLGGSLLQSDRPALTVSISGSLRGNLYLTGNIQNHYENNTWTFVSSADLPYEQSLEEEMALDYLELQYALYQSGYGEDARACVWQTRATVTYQGLYTKDMFFPLKLYEIRQFKDYSSKENKFTARHSLREGDSYSFQYLVLNYGSAAFYELVRSREEVVYQPGSHADAADFTAYINRTCPQLKEYVSPDGFEAVLAGRKESIYQNYMQIPDDLYADIKALTDDLTRGIDSDYEKLKAIEDYLQGFVYTVTPEKTEGDAVAAFLFETHEGYCTYFASAFVLMSRAAGIPARYVNGFCVPVYTENTRKFIVGSDRAHAWPEAYLNGIGWISFEPTSGFLQFHDTPWEYLPVSAEAVLPEQTLPETETELPAEITAEEEEAEPETGLNEALMPFAGRILSVCAFLVPAAMLLLCFFRLYFRRRRYRRSKREEQLALLLYYELLLLEGLSLRRRKEETLPQFAGRAAARYPQLMAAGLREFWDAYMESFYGGAEPEEEAVAAAALCVRRTEELYRGIRRLKCYVIMLSL